MRWQHKKHKKDVPDFLNPVSAIAERISEHTKWVLRTMDANPENKKLIAGLALAKAMSLCFVAQMTREEMNGCYAEMVRELSSRGDDMQ